MRTPHEPRAQRAVRASHYGSQAEEAVEGRDLRETGPRSLFSRPPSRRNAAGRHRLNRCRAPPKHCALAADPLVVRAATIHHRKIELSVLVGVHSGAVLHGQLHERRPKSQVGSRSESSAVPHCSRSSSRVSYALHTYSGTCRPTCMLLGNSSGKIRLRCMQAKGHGGGGGDASTLKQQERQKTENTERCEKGFGRHGVATQGVRGPLLLSWIDRQAAA